jgi:ribosomal protein L37E
MKKDALVLDREELRDKNNAEDKSSYHAPFDDKDSLDAGTKKVITYPEPKIVMEFKEKQKFCKRCGKSKPNVDTVVCPYCRYGLTKDGNYNKRIKSVWTHEPWLHFKVVPKSRKIMGDYIALHGWVPQNELPVHLRYKIPENEIWMRTNVYNDPMRRRRILTHEHHELALMVTHSMSYKEAHKRAEFVEHFWFL